MHALWGVDPRVNGGLPVLLMTGPEAVCRAECRDRALKGGFTILAVMPAGERCGRTAA